jgi:hypothetical protein
MIECPRCNNQTLDEIPARNALSRADNETYVCSNCGTEEAMLDYSCHAATGHPFHGHFVTTVTSTIQSLIGLAMVMKEKNKDATP